MKKNIIIVFVLLLILAGATYLMTLSPQDPPKGKMVTGSPSETFSGKIESVDNSCFADGICSITVDGKKVILVIGSRALPEDTKVGSVIGAESLGDLETKIGWHANVYATTTPEGDYSIYGKEDYYVEILNIK